LQRLRFKRAAQGFLLLECMLAVFIFAAASLGLARCVQNCMRAERFRREESLAQRALANYWAQIELGAIPIATDNVTPEKLKGAWEGMVMAIAREPLTLKNEKEQDLFGLYKVTLTLSWGAGQDQQVRTLDFIIYPRTR
jgi:Tfp pilus assembly protein PilV